MRTIVVTGGATGIGFAIARRLGLDGNAVVLASRKRDRLEAAQERLRGDGIECEIAPLDVRDHQAVGDLFASLEVVDGVVNNAAGNFVCPTADLSPNGFKAVVEISLYGTFYCSQALARRLIAEGRPGAILNIVATYAWTGAPGVAHSAAAKAGVVAFTKSVSREPTSRWRSGSRRDDGHQRAGLKTPSKPPYDLGISFVGSTKGIGTTTAGASPAGVSTASSVPSSERATGTMA